MSPDPFDIRRIDVGDEMAVWVPVKPPGGGNGDSSPGEARPAAWRVRPYAVALGGAFAAVALVRIGLTPAGLLGAGLLGVLTVLATIDLERRLLPNRIVVPAIAAVLAWQLTFFPGRLVEAVIAGAGAALFLLVPALVHHGAMGMGDVKLAALLGAALGGEVVPALTVGLLVVFPVAIVLLVRGASARGATIPLAPFLAFGAAVVVLA